MAFSNRHYKLLCYINDGGELIGFIAYWQLPSCRYIEHFAISPLLRGKGYGHQLLHTFVEQEGDGIVVLEIDPVVDEFTAARLRFYEQCGFVQNPYQHRHPAYDKRYTPHALTVLSSGRTLRDDEYQAFRTALSNTVMHFSPTP